MELNFIRVYFGIFESVSGAVDVNLLILYKRKHVSNLCKIQQMCFYL